MDDGRTSHRPQTDHPASLAQTRPATNCQGAASLQVAVFVRLCLSKQWSDLLVVAADGLDCRLHARAQEFARALGAGPEKQVLVVLDQAGWHISEQLVIPEGLHLVFLPPYSPELQPAEHLWELSDEAIANRHFQDLAELIDVQAERCRKLQELPELIRNRT